MIVLMAVWKRVYVYAASLVGSKEGKIYGFLAAKRQSEMCIVRVKALLNV